MHSRRVGAAEVVVLGWQVWLVCRKVVEEEYSLPKPSVAHCLKATVHLPTQLVNPHAPVQDPHSQTRGRAV